MAGSAGYADLSDDRENQILGGDAGVQPALDIDGHALGLALQQGLRGEHVADFGGADPESEGAEGSMGAGVAVSANYGHSRLRHP